MLPETLPAVLLLPSWRVPALTVVAPVYVLSPVKVRVAEPFLVTQFPAPVLEITPANVPPPLAPPDVPMVRVWVLRKTLASA